MKICKIINVALSIIGYALLSIVILTLLLFIFWVIVPCGFDIMWS